MVLLGDAFDTRPFRLPWPEGTVIYCVAPAAAHQQADAAFKAQQARVPRGCLLRRVPAELHQDGSFASALERSGLRGDRLSVWVVQVGAAAETRFPMSCLARQRLGYRPALCSCAAMRACPRRFLLLDCFAPARPPAPAGHQRPRLAPRLTFHPAHRRLQPGGL